MPTQQSQVEITADLQHKLELLQQAYRLPSTTAVLELLISTQIDRSVYEMTGIKPGPKLAIDNTQPTGQEGRT